MTQAMTALPSRDTLLAGDTFGVYIHWPFCAAKCPYCDFNSHVRHTRIDQALYLDAYRREIAYMAALSPGRRAHSVFFGGGTPSLMEPQTVAAILEAVNAAWPMEADCEITLEANPSSVEAERFAGYRAAGVNRVSLGVQSFDDAQLKFLGRLHDSAQARQAIEIARNTFERISFDLIYARPGQSEAQWREELTIALDLAADHLSLYQLTIEQGTPFFDLQARGRLKVPDPDAAARLYEITAEQTGRAGYETYEISNYARPGSQCRHNLVYWRYHDYAGIGAGAHGRLTVDGAKLATACERNPEKWWQAAMTDGHGMVETERLGPEETGDEMLLMGLRLTEGLTLDRFEAIAGRKIDPKRIEFLAGHGLIASEWGRLRVTPAGALVLDAVVADLAA